MSDILTRINEKYNQMSKGHRAIADYILAHYDQAAFLTAKELGEELGISESTAVRFASFLGYEGYPKMQRELAGWVRGKLGSVQKVSAVYRGRSDSEVLENCLGTDMENIRRTMEELDPGQFDLAVSELLEAETVYVVGTRSCAPLAEFLTFYLNMIRGNVVCIHTSSSSEIFEQMFRVGSHDAVVGISFPRYSMRTLKALEFANDRNARVISITDSIHSPLNLYSSLNLCAASEMVSIVDSLTAPLSLINALVVALCLKRPDQVKQSLESLEETWRDYQVYGNDEMDYIDENSAYRLNRDDHE